MKKGFTLVELLAVITILAIIALIAVPIVLNIIKDSKEASLKKSILFYIDAAEKNISSMQTNNPDYEPNECIIQENGNVVCMQNGEVLKVTDSSNELEVQMKGKKPTSGKIKLQDNKVVDIIDIYLDGKYANYDLEKNIIFYLYAFPTEAGLYDGNRNLLATWDELVSYGFDISVNRSNPNSNNSTMFKTIIANHSELKDGKILVISDDVTNIGGFAFYQYTGLTSIIIPSDVESIGGSAFYGCTGLTSIIIPSSVTSIGYAAFYGCSGLKSIIVESGNTVYEDKGSNVIIEKSTNTLILGCENTIIPEGVVSIGDYAFNGQEGLTNIVIPNSVTSIGRSAFYGCTGLKNIIIPNSVTSIGKQAFYGCTGLTNITISDNVTSIEQQVFYGCSSLTNITIPNSVISIGDSAFYGCKGLTSIIIPSSVTSIKNAAFQHCTGLTSITIPSSVTSIGRQAFYGCSNLASITFGNISGWFIATLESDTSGTNIDVTNTSTNATNLIDTYKDNYWKRNS